jgi:hypothetical protein
MGYKKLNPERYNERKNIVDRLKRLNEPFAYGDDVSLATYEAAVERVKVTMEAKNAKLSEVDLATDAYNEACALEDQLLKALRNCIGGVKGRNSDEYVIAGGTRLSDILTQQQETRENKKKAAEEEAKKAAEEAIKNAVDEAVKKASESNGQ